MAIIGLFACAQLQAQTNVIVPAANNAGTGSTASPHRKPLGSTRAYERSAMKYTQQEIGMLGNITAIAFYCDSILNPGNSAVKVYIKEVPDSSFTATTVAAEETGATLVYNDTIHSALFVRDSFTNITLTTPFQHLTTNNIEVIVETNSGGTAGTDLSTVAKGFRYFAVGTNRFQYWQSPNGSGTIPAGNGTLNNNRPNIRLTITPAAACVAPPTAGVTLANPMAVCAGVNSVLSLNGNTTGLGMTYQWLSSPDNINWTAIAGATNTTHAQPMTTSGYYRCVLTCSGFSDSSTSVLVTVNPSPVVTVNSPSICRGTPATLIAHGAVTYTWSFGVTNPHDSTGTANPFNTSTYTVTGTSGGCTSTAVATVTVNQLPNVQVNPVPPICTGQTALLIANGAATYSWSAGATFVGHDTATASPSITTTYTVTGTSVNGCTATGTVIVTNNSPIITVNAPTICTGNSAILVANGANTYTWSAGATPIGVDSASVSPAVTTTYTVTGTGAGCTSTATVTVTVVNSLNVIVNSPTICTGQTAYLVASGASNYTWSAGATSISIDSASANPTTLTSYTVTGTSGSCSSSAVATVTVNPMPVVTVNSLTLCRGSVATLIAHGASTYTWSNGATSQGDSTATASPNFTSTYTVTGTSAGCSATATSTVTVVNSPNVGVNSATICSGQTANLLAGGATSYVWSAGATSTGVNTATASPVVTTTYTVTGTTGICSNTAVATVTVNPTPVVTVNSPTICTAQTASFIASGATSYTWSAGATSVGIDSAYANPTTSTTYTVTGTTGNCSSTAVATVTVVNSLTVTVNSPAICNGQTAILVAGGANNYTWSTGAVYSGINTATASPTTTSTYTVTGSSGTCTGTAVATVTVSSNDNTTNTAGYTITANQAGATYQWINCTTHTPITGATNQSYTATVSGSYAVTINNGTCTDTSTCVGITVLGITELNTSNSVSVYPNPFTSSATITFTELQKNTIVNIINLFGENVSSVVLNGANHLTIEKGTLHSGVYLIQIKYENGTVVNKKVVVQ